RTSPPKWPAWAASTPAWESPTKSRRTSSFARASTIGAISIRSNGARRATSRRPPTPQAARWISTTAFRCSRASGSRRARDDLDPRDRAPPFPTYVGKMARMEFGWTCDAFESQGEDIYFECAGSNERGTIVFCHGAGGNHAIWFQQLAHFAPSYRVVTW